MWNINTDIFSIYDCCEADLEVLATLTGNSRSSINSGIPSVIPCHLSSNAHAYTPTITPHTSERKSTLVKRSDQNSHSTNAKPGPN